MYDINQLKAQIDKLNKQRAELSAQLEAINNNLLNLLLEVSFTLEQST